MSEHLKIDMKTNLTSSKVLSPAEKHNKASSKQSLNKKRRKVLQLSADKSDGSTNGEKIACIMIPDVNLGSTDAIMSCSQEKVLPQINEEIIMDINDGQEYASKKVGAEM